MRIAETVGAGGVAPGGMTRVGEVTYRVTEVEAALAGGRDSVTDLLRRPIPRGTA